MKDYLQKLIYGLLVWFTLQLILLSAVGNANGIRVFLDPSEATTREECADHLSPITGVFMGVMFPITNLNVMRHGDFCWNFDL